MSRGRIRYKFRQVFVINLVRKFDSLAVGSNLT